MKRYVRYKTFDAETHEVFNIFSKKDGAEHIATPVTIQALLDLQQERPLQHVLEMGAGIGTLTYAMLKNPDTYVDLYEDDAFCQEALKKNLSLFTGRYTILRNYRDKPPRDSYDLFIVDGGSGKGTDGGSMRIVQSIIAAVDNLGIVYVEGGRHIQRALVRRELSKRFCYRLVEYKSVEIDGCKYKGGLAIHCTPVRNAFLRSINHTYWALFEWISLKNAISYRIQRFKSLVV